MRILGILYSLVFSTYVEMILIESFKDVWDCGILHVCGDDPDCVLFMATNAKYSPRMWR